MHVSDNVNAIDRVLNRNNALSQDDLTKAKALAKCAVYAHDGALDRRTGFTQCLLEDDPIDGRDGQNHG